MAEEMAEIIEMDEGYRDNLATVDKSGKRIWIYPKKPKGQFYNWRKIVSYVLLIVLFGLPFIKVNGEPFVMFNIPETKFIIFGVYFAPQDFHLFVIAMITAVVFITLFTAIFGRLFCGWVCPQTIFMEMVFRRIEYWIEGDANAQKRLNKAPWTSDKVVKKAAKHAVFIVISILIAHTFLSYIIGVDQVWQIVTEPISEHLSGFIAMVIFTIVFYGVFSVMREQVCTSICPYGRLQGVLLDQNSLAVSYDFVRGEPRGKIKKLRKPPKKEKKSDCDSCENCKSGNNPCPSEQIAQDLLKMETQQLGDCIDCRLCVQVCPTGIDIRNGTQLECVNCTACMDACDEVMLKVKRPTGLVRIDSYNGITKGQNTIWTKRVMAYSAVLLVLVVFQSFLFITRSEVETLFLRTPGMLFQEREDGYISNLYNYQLINKTSNEYPITFKIDNIEEAELELIGADPITTPNAVSEGAVFIKIPKDVLKGRKTDIKISVYSDDKRIDKTETSFLGPIK